MAQVNAIYLRDNRIKAWSGGPFRHSPILAILDLSENLLTEVSDLGLASMSQLNLQGNEINYLSCRGLPTALKSLNLAYNNIKKIDSDCDTLFQQINEFDISFNNLVSNGMNIKESVLDKLKQILVLNIAGNNITRIRHKTTFNQYRRLNISYNPMTLTELSEFMGRGTSYLMMIDISSLKFEQLPDEYWRFYQILRILHIKDNGLKELNYANRTRYDNNVVLELDVSGNKMNNFFSSIKARLASLEKLNVARNGISDICYRSLAIQFPVIQILDARMNKIDRLQRRCFKGMGKLRVLLLQGNNLAYVSGKSFYGPPEMVTVLTKRDYLCCMVPAKIKLCQPSMGSDDLSSCENLLSHFSQKLFIWIVGILAVVGNLLVFIQNHSIRKQKNSLVPIFLINSLALSDLLMAFYLIIIIVADLAFSTGEYGLNSEIWLSSPFCLIACFLVNASSLTTVLLMVTICSDRYICLVYPLSPKRMSIKTARIVVVFVWILSLSFAAAPVISSANMPGYLRLYTYNSMCMANNYQIDYYRVWMISYLSIIFIAWVAMTILYMRLFMTIRRSGKNLRRSTATDNTVIAIRLALILISDLISWVPFYYVNLHGLLTSGRVDVIALQFVGIFSLPINSAINPYLYTFTNIDIIKKFLVRQKTFSTKS